MLPTAEHLCTEQMTQQQNQTQTHAATAFDVAVIIVTWNTRDLTVNAVRSVLADLDSSGLQGRVIVVDNASGDGTAGAIRDQFGYRAHQNEQGMGGVEVIESGANIGFGAGNNLALLKLGFNDRVDRYAPYRESTDPGSDHLPKAVFFLNPDTITPPGTVRALYDALMNTPRAGIVGPCLQYEDGSFQNAAFRFPRLRQLILDLYPLPNRVRARLYETSFNGRYPRALYTQSERDRRPFQVDFTLGAAMMTRREALLKVGLFDEQFFMYCEEVDLALRMQQGGYSSYVAAYSCLIHLESKSASQVRPRSLINLWTSRHKYYRKHASGLMFQIARLSARIGFRFRINALKHRADLTAEDRDALIHAYRLADRAWSGKQM